MEEANNLKNVMLMYSKSLKNKEKFIYVGTEKITFQGMQIFLFKIPSKLFDNRFRFKPLPF